MTPEIKPFKIRDVEINPPLVLSPMAGDTDVSFRRLIKRRGGVGLSVSEFISVEGLTRSNPKSKRQMRFYEDERPFAVQIFGGQPERMAMAAEMAQEVGADIVDINCGCPAPKVVKHLFTNIAPRFKDRAGGYTRIVKLGKNRLGDGAELALLQFVGAEEGPEVGGRVSTRRRIADKRTAYAAKVRKELAAKSESATEKA